MDKIKNGKQLSNYFIKNKRKPFWVVRYDMHTQTAIFYIKKVDGMEIYYDCLNSDLIKTNKLTLNENENIVDFPYNDYDYLAFNDKTELKNYIILQRLKGQI